jgi:hypothetical protein
MQPGDCIYYNGHVVMYIGNGKIIHASPRGVVETNLYDRNNIQTIRRFLPPDIDVLSIADFDLYHYLHSDLQNAFHGNHDSLRKHLLDYGLKEGRIFSYVFDPRFYSNKYGDIKNAFGDNFRAVTQHYFDYGINEGRQGSIIFDVNYYKNSYGDLRNAFGEDKKNMLSILLNMA